MERHISCCVESHGLLCDKKWVFVNYAFSDSGSFIASVM
ncbi:hypothetical protein Krac_4223 [Ktedonobacter racemifer DSM 44963]|uniref:Uncharacterized protein n=1 Tax=Ktedonobacter racemifer DSM 44963 TaxID=485913 RepID=D6TS79_KTERA|nr:hypothetical protein Krac_4223 [Ktedonobacter racemifer DSM 44963]